ncbi:MAG: hypothetical protein IKO03_01230 [Lachnospiraceae bacterium]|nr:hypothetical protein [Lachnospiraceae bacterium]MBR3507399.1 hypothetical protein [Lachnospiraceae bacterium]MBR4608004.1 hypothetical protein [Lachnospiraceae bacterium]MBR6150863.1 hypothetical protein [Lachnospiraceae bacterium]
MYNYLSKDGKEITEVVRAEDFLVMEEYLAYEEPLSPDVTCPEEKALEVLLDNL